MKKLNTRQLRCFKKSHAQKSLQMLTAYDFQTAQLLNETSLDMILVGDSLGNVVLGHDTTIQVTLEEMIIFSRAVKKGAPNKFVLADLPFGRYATFDEGISSAAKLFQESNVEALKLEGAFPHHQELIERLTQTGIPIMGHIGLTPQSVHQQGGYYTHGKDNDSALKLIQEAKSLENVGCFAIVLECIAPFIARKITETVNIPTIGIGSGNDVDGQVLVINDLLKLGREKVPRFCQPVANLYQEKKDLIDKYLAERVQQDQSVLYINNIH